MNFKYIYGPVQSWRMGKSLGIDPLSDRKKVCNLDCIYCQLGRTPELTTERKEYVPTDQIADEIEQFFGVVGQKDRSITEHIDYLTFSGRGEPTLAKNLGEMIRVVRRIRGEELAVITNATLLHLPEVQNDLVLSDLVVAKLDACHEKSFCHVDKPSHGISFEVSLEGIKKFRQIFHGRLAIRIMFVDENRKYAKKIADIVRDIDADEVQINTPLRPSASSPLDPQSIEKIKTYFTGMPVVTVYDRNRKRTTPFNIDETLKRHGYF